MLVQYVTVYFNTALHTLQQLKYRRILTKIVVMGQSTGPAWAWPGPVHFSRDRARIFEKGPSLTQARDRFLEKGLDNWDFYVVKNTGPSRLGIELL